jgi:hypothetical protein
MKDLEIIQTTKAGSLKRQYLLTKNVLSKQCRMIRDDDFIIDTMKLLVNKFDSIILNAIENEEQPNDK